MNSYIKVSKTGLDISYIRFEKCSASVDSQQKLSQNKVCQNKTQFLRHFWSMSKCLEICKEIWRSLSLVWWNFSQVWSQKLWFFDSAIFECLHNTWHSRDLVTTSSVIIHSEDEKIVQKIFLWIQNKIDTA